MADLAKYYLDGRPIEPGNKISLGGRKGEVIFVLGHPSVPAQYVDQIDWYKQEFGRGFFLQVEGVGHIFMSESNEDLLLLGP